MKAFVARVAYRSEDHGVLDVDFAIDTLDELRVLIENGPGLACLVSVVVERPVEMPVNESIESLIRQMTEREGEDC